MKTFTTLLFVFLGLACTAQTQPVGKTDLPFDISLQVENLGNNQYNLVVDLILEKGKYVVSPFSKDETYGHFIVSIEQTNKLIADNTLSETPTSVEEHDPILNMPVRFVRKNTTYKRKFNVRETSNFEVSGLIEFVLEPDCIPYDVSFVISKQSGTVKVKETNTIISKEYKQ